MISQLLLSERLAISIGKSFDHHAKPYLRLLQRSGVDFIVMDTRLERSNIETVILGHEQYVIIENKKSSSRDDAFLDNDFNDRTTEQFLKVQGVKATKFRRSYFDDCYGIMTA